MSFAALAAIRGVEAPGPSALLLLFVLAEYAGADGCCYPSQRTLSERAKLSERAVRDNLRLLEEAGLIRQQRRNRKDGTRTSNLIRLVYYKPEETEFAGGCDVAKPAAKSAGSLGAVESDNRQLTTGLPAISAGPTTFEPVREPITPLSAREILAVFDRWWEIYPRKIERPAALKIFSSILRRGGATGEQLIAGAQREAITTHGREPNFIKSPTTWLQRESWVAEPAAANPVRDEAPLGSTRVEFAGPAQLRAAAVAARDESWVRAWIDPCGWDAATKALIPRGPTARDRINQELGRHLRSWSVTLTEPRKEHA